ncbi:MAG: hypothetical protein IAF38_18800 [Bacteroidia bacterium]|nr:hypothetical protein [Bacteroidia bacterium]
MFAGLLSLGFIFLMLMAGLWYTHQKNSRMENILAELKSFYKKENVFNAKFVLVSFGEYGERIERYARGKIIYFPEGFFVIHTSKGLSPFVVEFWGFSSASIPTENKPHSFLSLNRTDYEIKENELICKSSRLFKDLIELIISHEQDHESGFKKFSDYFKMNYIQ